MTTTTTTSAKPSKAPRRMLTSSLVGQFTRCRKRYKFSHIERLEPRTKGKPLSFGSLFHDGLERFYGKREVLFGGMISEWKTKHREMLTEDPEGAVDAGFDEETIDKMSQLAGDMLMGYVKRWAADFQRYEILAIELPFRFPLKVPAKGGKSLGRKSPVWDYGGKLDLVVRDKTTGIVWLIEHKTTQETDPESYMRQLQMKTQPRGYIWALKQIAAERGWGPVGGVIYNVARKKSPAIPKTVQCKKCKGTGERPEKPRSKTIVDCSECATTGVGGISKASGTDTTPAIYIAAIKAYPHLDIQDYGEVLQKLSSRGDRFFWRRALYMSDDDILDWQLDTYEVARDIAKAERFYRNQDACMVFGRPCPFWRICLEDEPIARANFDIRERELPEMDTPQEA